MRSCWACWLVMLVMSAPVCFAEAEDKRDEPDIEYVEDKPDGSEEPTNPFGKRSVERDDALAGLLELSDGKKFVGELYLTRDAKLRFYHRAKKKLLFFELRELTHIECRVLVERMEPEWRWKENANDEKVYTGRHYPMRELETVLHLKDAKELVGDCTALLYLRTENGASRFIIRKRQKGKVGQKLEDLLYVKLVDFRPPTDDTVPEPDKQQ